MANIDLTFANLQQYVSLHHPDASLSNFYLLSGGWECDIYAFTETLNDGRSLDLILRLFLGQESAEKATRESAGLIRLLRAGYPVPEVFLFDTDSHHLGHAFIIMEKIEGQSLWGVLNSAASEREDQLLDQFGQLVARLHRLDWQPFTTAAARYQAEPTIVLDEWLATSRRLYSEFEVEGFLLIADWLDAHKKDITAEPAVVHLDFHANNVLLGSDDLVTVIDWSQLTVADYRCDLSWTLMIMGDHGKPGWAEKILSAYTHAVGHPVLDLSYFDVMSMIKLLASTVISLKVGPEQLGLRPRTVETRKEQAQYLRILSQRLQAITGLAVPEIQMALRQIE